LDFKKNIIHLNQVESTNCFAKEILNSPMAKNWTVIFTNNQTKGKGQRGNTWKSNPNENLAFSIIIETNINVEKQFYISKIISLALMDYLSDYVDNVRVKWPNDIYVNDKKIAGILIENIIQGSNVIKSIVGIGININQTTFDSNLPNPISLKQITNKTFILENVLIEILNNIYKYHESLNNYKFVDTIYNKSLFGLNKILSFKEKDDSIFSAKILGTDESGKIKLETDEKIKFYNLNEIKFIIK
jgi:BirA family biotin operon repressor/biotin-[acetyl-CoA-carboxylase] ligase